MDALFTFGDQTAREAAYWYPHYGDLFTRKQIAVQNMNETVNSYGRIAENLEDAANTITLRTRYLYNYEPPHGDEVQHIFYRDTWYEIQSVKPRELGNLGMRRYVEYLLTLIEVNYSKDFGVVSAPVASKPTGEYAAFTLTLSCPTKDATIYYTTDGRNPTKGSNEYLAPISVSATTKVKAIAVKKMMIPSNISVFDYTIS